VSKRWNSFASRAIFFNLASKPTLTFTQVEIHPMKLIYTRAKNTVLHECMYNLFVEWLWVCFGTERLSSDSKNETKTRVRFKKELHHL
jgi:hypothetical protein